MYIFNNVSPIFIHIVFSSQAGPRQNLYMLVSGIPMQ